MTEMRDDEWMPIETAPKEGVFLVYRAEGRGKRLPYSAGHSNVTVMYRHANVSLVDCHFHFDMEKPTHWMHLPPPPRK